MAEGTEIGWCDIPGHVPTTQNPIVGCSRRSEGCGLIRWLADRTGSCYAIHSAVRQRNLPGRGGLVARRDDGVLDWTGAVALLPQRLRMPLGWPKPHAVFVNALGELMDDAVPDAFIAAQWVTMFYTSRAGRHIELPGRRRRARPVHIYMILTKLPARLRSFMRRWCDPAGRRAMVGTAVEQGWCTIEDLARVDDMPAVLDNVWLGVSVETQRWADIRLPILREVPAVVRFASCEPLLGPLTVDRYLADGTLQWVIVGGESDKDGKKARPMHPDWPRRIRRECQAHGVPFFFKQNGSYRPAVPGEPDPGRPLWLVASNGRFVPAAELDDPATAQAAWAQLIADGYDGRPPAPMYLVGKAAAGEDLDGRHYREWPALEPAA